LFHDVRLVFYIADATSADYNPCRHWIVQVIGDTEFEVTIPYAQQGLANLTTQSVTEFFNLYYKVLSWSQESTGTGTPIYLNVYKSAAEDFRVYGQYDTIWTPTCNPRDDFKKPFQVAPGDKMYETKGYIYGEEITTMRDLCHRYQCTSIPPAGPATAIIGLNTVVAHANPVNGIDYWSKFFFFWRGSIRFKILASVTDTTSQLCVTSTDGRANFVGNSLNNPVSRWTEAELPWYKPLLWDNTDTTAFWSTALTISYEVSPAVCKAGGDDFSLMFMKLPAAGVLSTSGSIGQGVVAFQAFCVPGT